ncbi:MAG: hypothetical protein WD847_13700 [Pirellulales bacterium]
MWGVVCRWILAPLVFRALVNKRELHGLLVAEGPHRRFQDEGFHDAVAEALDVLERYDPRRFARVGRNLRAICNGPLASTALYQPHTGICWIDMSRFESWRGEAALAVLLAATIVHEATHGELRRLARTRRNLREEAICHREEWRCFKLLASRAGIEVSQEWLEEVQQFDPSWHREYYARPWLAHLREQWRRIYGAEGFWGSLRREWGEG